MKKRSIGRLVIVVMLLLSLATSAFAATYSTLRYRDEGEAVKQMQIALNKLGFSTGGTDGKFGPATEKAVRQFQSKYGLKVDGLAGNQTLTLLYEKADGTGSSSGNASSSGSSAGSTGGASGSTSASKLFGGDYSTLKYGSRGDRVKTLQQALNDLGYSAGSVDGKFGAGTQRAVVAFQQANKLTADGKAGTNTLKAIESKLGGSSGSTNSGTSSGSTSSGSTSGSTSSGSSGYVIPTRTLRKGYTGDDVKSVQTRLKELGYYTKSIDGKYGSGTIAAVEAFQAKNGLNADGLAGSQTCKVLFSSSAVAAGSSSSSSGSTSGSTSSGSSGSSGYTVPTRTLRKGYTGDDVQTVQTRLKELGYYTKLVDGNYGSGTIAAVKAFQEKHGLTADGVAGTATYKVLFSDSAKKADTSSGSTSDDNNNGAAADQPTANAPAGGWPTLRRNSTGSDVVQLQEALALLKYPVGVSSDKSFDYATVWAVECFQRRNGLKADGVAGPTTLAKLYGGQAVGADTSLSTTVAKGKAPGGADLELLHWFDDIKAYLKSNRVFTVYDPATGLSWKMRLYSAGNHADSEPVTQADTDTMYKAWGNQWSWNEKPVYVQLANGTWCIASMPNMPHLSGGISDNGFDGHTCVHFPRTMTEVQKNDPVNAGRHNRDIRVHWRSLTGEDIPW